MPGRVKITDELGVRFRLEVEGEFDSVESSVFPLDVAVDSERVDCDIGMVEELARFARSAYDTACDFDVADDGDDGAMVLPAHNQ